MSKYIKLALIKYHTSKAVQCYTVHEKERSKSQFKTIEIVLGIYGTIFWFGEDEPNTDGKTQDEEETSSSALNKRSFMGTK